MADTNDLLTEIQHLRTTNRALAADLLAQDLKFREHLWISHCHLQLYGDDGEMQCSECQADYLHDPVEALVEMARAAHENTHLALTDGARFLSYLAGSFGIPKYAGGEMVCEAQVAAETLDRIREWLAHPLTPLPIPMILYCPKCHVQHIDCPQPEKGWTNPPHRSHECQATGCGFIWRPADVPTVGVVVIFTNGRRDSIPRSK